MNTGTTILAQITLYGLRGERVLSAQVIGERILDLSHLHKGVYILQSASVGGVAILKVVVE